MADQQNKQNTQTGNDTAKKAAAKLRADMLAMAVNLRLKGLRYEMISMSLQAAGFQAKENTVREWFSVGGDCHEFYQAMRKKRLTELQEQSQEMEESLQEAAVDAMAIIKSHLTYHKIPAEILSSARDVLDRAGYPKTSKIEGKHEVKDDNMAVVANGILKILGEKRV